MNSNNLPPVRVIQNDRLKNFCQKITEGIEKASAFITGQKVVISPFEPFLMPMNVFTSAYQKKSVILKIHSDSQHAGTMFFTFEFKTAIAMGAFVRLQTESAIEDKIKQENFEAADFDSFGEVGNQLGGILDREFRQLCSKKMHLRLDFEKIIYPQSQVKEFTAEYKDEFVVFLSNIELPKAGAQKMTLIIPRHLLESMLSMEIELENIQPNIAVLYSSDEDFCMQMQRENNNRHGKILVAKDPEETLLLAKKQNVCAVAIELPPLSTPLGHKENIFLKRFGNNELIMKKLPCYFSVAQASPDLISQIQSIGIHMAKSGDIKNEFAAWVTPFLSKK